MTATWLEGIDVIQYTVNEDGEVEETHEVL